MCGAPFFRPHPTTVDGRRGFLFFFLSPRHLPECALRISPFLRAATVIAIRPSACPQALTRVFSGRAGECPSAASSPRMLSMWSVSADAADTKKRAIRRRGSECRRCCFIVAGERERDGKEEGEERGERRTNAIGGSGRREKVVWHCAYVCVCVCVCV